MYIYLFIYLFIYLLYTYDITKNSTKKLQMTHEVQKQKHHNLKCYPKFTKRETLVDQWSVQLIAIVQRFENTLITSYNHM